MRRILSYTRNGISAIATAARRFGLIALATGAVHAVGSQDLRAQYPQLFAGSTAQSMTGLPLATGGSVARPQQTSAVGGVMTLGSIPTTRGANAGVVDSTFRGNQAAGTVAPASYFGDMCYQQLRSAERSIGYSRGETCDINWYVNVEGLFFRREGDRRFTLTNTHFMNNVDFEFGGRFTAGKMFDCVNSFEFVYAGPFQWSRRSDVSGPGTINSNFIAGPGGLAAGFNGADRHIQDLRQELSSYELNRRWWAWDAVSTLIGIRYLRYEDRYSLISLRPPLGAAPLSSLYQDETDNNMVGLQVGGDVYMPTSLRTLVSFKGKAGLYGNFTTRDVLLGNDGAATLRNGDDDVELSGLIEIGMNGIYQVTPSVRLTAGYEAWFMPGVATTSQQIPRFLTAGSGASTRVSDDIVFHGFNFGTQVLF